MSAPVLVNSCPHQETKAACFCPGSVTRQKVDTLKYKKYGFPSMHVIGWSDLRQTLVDWLPPGTVQLGKQFTTLEQHNNHVALQFADGSSVEAIVVVGADGVFSKVRRQNLADGLPEYTVSSAPAELQHAWSERQTGLC